MVGSVRLASNKRYIYIYIYRKTSLTYHHHRSTISLYRLLYLGLKRSPMTIPQLPKSTTSLNGPLNVGPMVGRFREVYTVTVPWSVDLERCYCIHLSKSTDHGTDFKWSLYGGGRFMKLLYLYGRSFGTEIKRSI